jgi:hypothetical protein
MDLQYAPWVLASAYTSSMEAIIAVLDYFLVSR